LCSVRRAHEVARANHCCAEHRAFPLSHRRADGAANTVAGARPAVLQDPRCASQAR
jgi:hypothetical protein